MHHSFAKIYAACQIIFFYKEIQKMKNTRKIRIAVVGYGFGSMFAKLFQLHPNVKYVGICESNLEKIALAKQDGFTRIHHDYHEVLASDDYDAVYLGLPVEFHARPAIEVLNAGKHCACAVPMAFTLDDLSAIIAAGKKSGKNYMMMETNVYVNTFFYVRDLYEKGELGRIQFLRGIHSQSIEGWPGAWVGLPPMWYATHALSPLLALVKSRATRVTCYGSGDMSEELVKCHNNPYPVETMTFTIENCKAVGEVTRTLFETAPMGGENFEIYGSKGTFSSRTGEYYTMSDKLENWGRGLREKMTHPEFPMRWDLLPTEFQEFSPEGHGAAAMHLVHEFVCSIVEGRKSAIDAVTAANWCAVGICAHASALVGGKAIDIPKFD
jgi:predicted dehydrogenase